MYFLRSFFENDHLVVEKIVSFVVDINLLFYLHQIFSYFYQIFTYNKYNLYKREPISLIRWSLYKRNSLYINFIDTCSNKINFKTNLVIARNQFRFWFGKVKIPPTIFRFVFVGRLGLVRINTFFVFTFLTFFSYIFPNIREAARFTWTKKSWKS